MSYNFFLYLEKKDDLKELLNEESPTNNLYHKV